MKKQAKFANSESFQRLVARRKACGLEELELSKNEDPYRDHPFDEDLPSHEEKENDGQRQQHHPFKTKEIIPQNELFDVYVANTTTNSGVNTSCNNETLIVDEVSPTSALDYPENGDRNLPVFRDFDSGGAAKDTKKKGTLRRPFKAKKVEIPSGSSSQEGSTFGWKYPTTAIHDQLPSVEEVKAILYNSNAGGGIFRCQLPHKGRWSREMWAAAFSIFFVALLLIILIWNHSTRTETQSDTGDFLEDHYDPIRLRRVVGFLLGFGATEELALETMGKPQRKAAIFLAMNDVYSQSWLDQPKMEHRFLERFSLIAMYYGMNGAEWGNSFHFLNTTLDHCDWNANISTKGGDTIRMGVQCNPHGMVSKIDLSYNNLSGFGPETLPFELKNFKVLESLQLHNNVISGRFPSSITHLNKLKSLNLRNNKLEGRIPHTIGSMIALTELGLGSNLLSGEIPTSLSNLLNLRLLGLDNNRNLQGDIKQLFGSLKGLQFLYLKNNLISGTLDDDLVSNWKRMIDLDLNHNLIIGTISNAVLDMPNLQILDLGNNQIDGSLPHDIFENLILEYLELSNNNLHGEIPFKTALIWNLRHLDLSGNQLTGTIPDTIGNMSNLRYLATGGNNFEQHTVVDLRRLVDLKALSMKGNNLNGPIPAWLSQLENLEVLDLEDNAFTGLIPSPIGAMEDLSVLILSGNDLSGTIPNSLSLMTNLDIVLFDGNQLEGDAAAICNSTKVQPSIFAANCHAWDEETTFSCACCTLCCKADDTSCSNFIWSNTYDPSSEYGFVQPTYNGDSNNAPSLGDLTP